MKLTTEINTKELERALILAPKVLKYELADGMDHISKKFLKLFKRTRLQGPPGVKGRPHGIFSHFKRASLVSPTIEGMGMIIWSDSEIARMHEEGANLIGKFAVPLSPRTQMFKGGKYPARLRKRYKDPRSIKNLIRLEFNGKPFLAKIKRRTNEVLPLFVLKNRIRIKPRLGFYAIWDLMQNIRINILNKSIEKVLKKI